MIDKILECLIANYPSFNFVRYGTTTLPSSPYGIVKPEKGINGRNVRIILHRNPDEQEELETNLREVVKILMNQSFTSTTGIKNQLGSLIDYTDVTPLSDDGTISMEALFLMPTTMF